MHQIFIQNNNTPSYGLGPQRDLLPNITSLYTFLGLVLLAFVLVGTLVYIQVPKDDESLSLEIYASFHTIALVCMIPATALVSYNP